MPDMSISTATAASLCHHPDNRLPEQWSAHAVTAAQGRHSRACLALVCASAAGAMHALPCSTEQWAHRLWVATSSLARAHSTPRVSAGRVPSARVHGTAFVRCHRELHFRFTDCVPAHHSLHCQPHTRPRHPSTHTGTSYHAPKSNDTQPATQARMVQHAPGECTVPSSTQARS